MDPVMEDPWWQSPGGSAADYDTWQNQTTDNYDQPQGYDNTGDANVTVDDGVFVTADVYGASDLAPGQFMSVKVPPAFDGHMSWFLYEEMV